MGPLGGPSAARLGITRRPLEPHPKPLGGRPRRDRRALPNLARSCPFFAVPTVQCEPQEFLRFAGPLFSGLPGRRWMIPGWLLRAARKLVSWPQMDLSGSKWGQVGRRRATGAQTGSKLVRRLNEFLSRLPKTAVRKVPPDRAATDRAAPRPLSGGPKFGQAATRNCHFGTHCADLVTDCAETCAVSSAHAFWRFSRVIWPRGRNTAQTAQTPCAVFSNLVSVLASEIAHCACILKEI